MRMLRLLRVRGIRGQGLQGEESMTYYYTSTLTVVYELSLKRIWSLVTSFLVSLVFCV